MSSSFCLVDTNVLVYADDEESVACLTARKFLEKNLPDRLLAISWQNIIEYYSLITNQKRVPKAVLAEVARERIKAWTKSGLYKIVAPEPDTQTTLLRLLGDLPVAGPDIFDVALAATMIDNGIDTIYTADTRIFKKLGLKAINPLT